MYTQSCTFDVHVYAITEYYWLTTHTLYGVSISIFLVGMEID